MKREEMVARIRSKSDAWDLIIIGGGASGLGTAVDATSRGYRTLLLEQHDFAKGTSSRSTKMVHGGVRYLQQGNIALVLEALRERGILQRNAPHLVHSLPFVVPNYDWWEGPFYGAGLKMYDMLAGKLGFGRSRFLTRERTRELIPTVETEGLRGGIIYYDGQFDDARLAVDLAQTAVTQGGTILNYMRVTALLKVNDMVSGVQVHDEESGEIYELTGKVVVNATGPFTDSIRMMDDSSLKPIISPSQGVHLVLDKSFLPGDTAIMVPHTSDGRVLFAVPWHNRVVVGTTDTPIDTVLLEPRPQDEEIGFILDNVARYLAKHPTRQDVLSAYAGVRPLVAPGGSDDTASVSRDETILVSPSGLVTVAGGKWTTYRKMAEGTVDQAAQIGQLPDRPCATVETHIHGYHRNAAEFGELSYYGTDAVQIRDLMHQDPSLAERVHPELQCLAAQVVWAVRSEMARSVEDFLARRTRALLLDARRSIEAAPRVAEIMARELGRDFAWQAEQVASYTAQANGYLVR
ncbi:MAG TPA: glycerol-3-phosphate dehydrogenase/oxidase [Spirochaetia bacterium]|nr:glycerol-3-phosphate dehydrogenase/oxidase [Spirochaetia bacterium]